LLPIFVRAALVWYGDDDPPSEPAGRPRLRWNELEKEACSIARITSIIGDRWTLLIVRECFLGVTRFDAFEERLGISKRILAERLQKLVDNFILVKVPYQQHPLRLEYQLTSKGRELYPILRTMQHWGDKHLSGKAGRPSVVVHSCGRPSDPLVLCSECGEPLDGQHSHAFKGPGGQKNRHLPPLPAGISLEGTVAVKRGRRSAVD
jgi:DNA-binding HxlR family transcriptional regulator